VQRHLTSGPANRDGVV